MKCDKQMLATRLKSKASLQCWHHLRTYGPLLELHFKVWNMFSKTFWPNDSLYYIHTLHRREVVRCAKGQHGQHDEFRAQ